MDQVVVEFVQLLRRHHVRVSAAEGLDALGALQAVGLGARADVKDALRATLVKSREDVEAFDRLFDLYFGLRSAERPAPAHLHLHDHDHGTAPTSVELGEDLPGTPQADDHHSHSHAEDEAVDLRRHLSEDRLQPSSDIHGDPERLRLSLFAQELVLNRTPGALQQALQRITHQLRVRRARNVFNPGELVPVGGEEIPLDVTAGELSALVDHLHDLDVDPALIRELEAQADAVLAGLPQLIEAMVARQRALAKTGADDGDLRRRTLRKLVDFSAGEEREMEAAVRRLAREIHGAHTRRLRRDRTGRISLPQTLRRNFRYEGIPFRPVLRSHHEERPRLVVLCDVSMSTRNLARFWLHLVSQLHRLFSKVRTYVFVADVAEVTQLLEEQPLHRAVETIFGGGLIDADEQSDFGAVAERFVAEHLAAVTRRTTVVILGDGRNNGRPPRPELLREIAGRARRLIWLTPEPRWGWALGGCDMPLYEAHCDRVEVVRTAGDLAAFAGQLLETRGSARRSATAA